VTRLRRPPRRQGVVYGPIQNREGYEASSLIGRILGMLVVAAAVGVLAVGSLTFLGGQGGGTAGPTTGSPTPTAAAAESLPPTPPPAPPTAPPATAPPTEVPTLTPTVTEAPSPAATAEATPPGLEVREGPGFVTFGTANNSALRITDARTSFGLSERITWSAHLTETVNSVDVRIETYKRDPATGSEELVVREEVRPRVNGAQIFLRRLRPDRALDGPGTYVVRYLRGDTVMAEGSFEVRPEESD
jgi:hypothetical protein